MPARVFDESGADVISSRLKAALVSSANWAEVATKLRLRGDDSDCLRPSALEVTIVLIADDADLARALVTDTKMLRLSLGDRFCLAVAQRTERPALGTERSWRKLPPRLGVTTEIVR